MTTQSTMSDGPRMFDEKAQFGGITVSVDPINRRRSDQDDNAMAMFYEEQPFMWELTKDLIAQTIDTAQGTIDFLDVGTGSGVWSLLVARNTNARHILAIDKSLRAVEQARQNAGRNGLSFGPHLFSLRQEFYNISTAPYRSAKVIGLYPPYHLYPSEVEMEIPQHARGGIDGQQVFREQLVTANYHLAQNGMIIFNHMCLGRDGVPEFVRYVPDLVHDVALDYTNIFPPMRTCDFLAAVYGETFAEYQKAVSRKFPLLFYCDGFIRRKGVSVAREFIHNIDLKGRSWQDRIELHRQIALHGVKQ